MKKLFCLIIFLFILSCSNLEFIYNDNTNLINPLYNKTKVTTSGSDLVFMNSYLPMLFGENKNDEFVLLINVEEKKTKRSVETNQATSNLRYELRFNYTLISNKNDCIVFKKDILSNFSIVPKSAGYNYGTDASLEKKYELTISDNLNQFISFLSGFNLNQCK